MVVACDDRGVRRVRRRGLRVGALRARDQEPDARPAPVPKPVVLDGSRGDHHDLPLHVRVVLPDHSVLPVRAGLLTARGRRATAALRDHARDLCAPRAAHHRSVRRASGRARRLLDRRARLHGTRDAARRHRLLVHRRVHRPDRDRRCLRDAGREPAHRRVGAAREVGSRLGSERRDSRGRRGAGHRCARQHHGDAVPLGDDRADRVVASRRAGRREAVGRAGARRGAADRR